MGEHVDVLSGRDEVLEPRDGSETLERRRRIHDDGRTNSGEPKDSRFHRSVESSSQIGSWTKGCSAPADRFTRSRSPRVPDSKNSANRLRTNSRAWCTRELTTVT